MVHPQLKEYGSKNTKIKNLFVIRLMEKIVNLKDRSFRTFNPLRDDPSCKIMIL